METGKRHILVVDDEQNVPMMFRRKFRKHTTFEFLFAKDGQEALTLLEQHQNIRLILTDLKMPNMDGMTLLQHLKWFDGHIIIISAYADYDRQQSAKEAGAFDVLSKPIIWDDLEKTMNRAMQMHEQIQRLEALCKKLMAEKHELQQRVNELERQLTELKKI